MNRSPIAGLLFALAFTTSADTTINDGHIHYNQDVWNDLAPEHAVELLDDNHINRAIVFSTPAQGTDKLYRLAPQRIIPFIRPYRVFRDRFTWHSDPGVLEYLKQTIPNSHYRGFGEFHLFRKHKDTPILRRIMRLVANHELALSAHADAETIESLINMQPNLLVIWAHCGMDHPVAEVQRMLERYPGLYCELSFRDRLTDEHNQLTPKWKTLLEKYPRRFMTGMDTYIPRRWAHLPEISDEARHWLNQLSPKAARLIGGANIDRLFPVLE